MQYCSIEEAWGVPNVKKKRKGKNLYNSNIPKYIEDTSFLEGSHDHHCLQQKDNSKSIKSNRKRNKKRSPNVQISYDNANQEYRNFQLENNHIKKQEKTHEELLVEGFESGDELNSIDEINSIEELERTFNKVNKGNKVNDIEETDYTNTETENLYAPSINVEETDFEEETDIETDIDGDTDMDEEINEIVKDVKKNNTKKKTTDNTEIKDIDYRLNNLNRNMNMLIKKMDNNDFFDDDSNDNIHDLILFILFGVFMIFVLDTVHKLGRN